jgi:hypothetical protein
MSTPARVCSKTALKPLDSPSIRLRTNSKVLATNTRSTTGVKPRQGPMKAVAPLKSMIKSSNVLPGELYRVFFFFLAGDLKQGVDQLGLTGGL